MKVLESISALRLNAIESLLGNPPQVATHHNCVVSNFKYLASGVVAGIVSLELNSHRRHMAAQK